MTKIKIIFLGTSGSIPSKSRGLPSIAIHAKEWLLFDCGEGTQRQMMKYNVHYGRFKSIFITHNHLDHYLGLLGLTETYNLVLPNKKIPIFLPKDLVNSNLFSNKKNVELNQLKIGLIYENSEFEISAFPVTHIKNSFGFVLIEKDRIKFDEKKAYSFGLKGKMFKEIEEKGFVKIGRKKIKLEDVGKVKRGIKIVYSGDTVYSDEVISMSKDADVLIHDSTYLNKEDDIRHAHSTADEAAMVAKKANVKMLILVHINPRYNGKELLSSAKRIFKNVVLSEDGLTIDL